MKVDRGWIWRVVFLTSLIVTAIRAQDEQSDVEVSDTDEDLSLNEEELKVLLAEGEEEMVTIMDKDEMDTSGKDDGVENVSFQVMDSISNWNLKVVLSVLSKQGTLWFMNVNINGSHVECDPHQVIYKTPVPTGDTYFVETFDDGSLERYLWKWPKNTC